MYFKNGFSVLTLLRRSSDDIFQEGILRRYETSASSGHDEFDSLSRRQQQHSQVERERGFRFRRRDDAVDVLRRWTKFHLLPFHIFSTFKGRRKSASN